MKDRDLFWVGQRKKCAKNGHRWAVNVHTRMCEICAREEQNLNFGLKGLPAKWVLRPKET